MKIASHHKAAQDLLQNALIPFTAIQRDMLMPPDFEQTENDAEHSWSLAVLACSLAPYIDKTLDIGLVAQFSLVHDLVELYAGDISVWAHSSELSQKDNKEIDAFEVIKTRFGHFTWLIETIEAYERLDTNEARYVKAMDKYIALCIRTMDEGRFYKQHKITKEKFEKKLKTHRKKAHVHSGAAEYYEAIRTEIDAHPEFFHIDT